MYVSKRGPTPENERKIRMLVLFNTLREEDKDLVISMSDLLVRKHSIFPTVKMHKTGY